MYFRRTVGIITAHSELKRGEKIESGERNWSEGRDNR